MQLKILGVGNAPLLSVSVKTLDDAGILNISGLCRKLGVKRSTFLSKVATSSLEAAILHFAAIKKQRMCSPHCQRKTLPLFSLPATQAITTPTTLHIKPDG